MTARGGGRVLVTGGLGYVGSHVCVALAGRGWRPVIVDNLCNAKLSVLARLRELSGAQIEFHRMDIRDAEGLTRLMRHREFVAVLHFAGLKSVAESAAEPERYHEINVGGTGILLDVMASAGIGRIVFSSSATVYGEPERLPIPEDHPLRPQSPYGENKLAVEEMLRTRARLDPDFRYAALRYFNPIGAHPSGRMGEDPRGVPNNLLPYVAQVAAGRLAELLVFGTDYPTHDGTGVRDYVHVMDIATAHVAALDHLLGGGSSFTVNLGTGRGYSVLEVVAAFERASGRRIPMRMAPRRAGDVAACYADPALAGRLLGWKARAGLQEMCADAWRWQRLNPEGYPDESRGADAR